LEVLPRQPGDAAPLFIGYVDVDVDDVDVDDVDEDPTVRAIVVTLLGRHGGGEGQKSREQDREPS
jgi:hypothetical protein